MEIIQSIQHRIYTVRGERVMLDFDLALLYDVPTKALNQAVKRNSKRFPLDFMFRLNAAEWAGIRSQAVTASNNTKGFTQTKRNTTVTPYAFTDYGVGALSGVLTSDKAAEMYVAIMRAFVEIRRIVSHQSDLPEQLEKIKDRLGEHDVQLTAIYETMENLFDDKIAQRKWEDRKRIGFII